jgi:hypothetical protein
VGADGHIIIAKREDWDKANPGVPPSDIGLYTGTVLGVEACWGYWGDNLFEPNYGEEYIGTRYKRVQDPEGKWTWDCYELTPAEVEAAKKALEWFEGNHEQHEVWT